MNRTRATAPGLQALFQAGSLVGATDGQLLERFALREGAASEAAFAALVERHGGLVWRTCRSVLRDEHDAADAFQATFLVLVRKAGSLWVRDSLAPWLHRVAIRVAVEARRGTRRRIEIERHAASLRPVWAEEDRSDDLADSLHREINRLPERHRRVVVLCDVEGRSCEEAARQLRCPIGTVKSRLARARDRLREALGRRGLAPMMALARDPGAAIARPPQGLIASTVLGSASVANDPINAAGVVSKAAVAFAEGAMRAMIRAQWRNTIVVALAAIGLVVPAWFAFARQAAVERPASRAPAAAPKADAPPGDFAGNWIVRIPGSAAFALIRIEGPAGRPDVRLLAFKNPDFFDLARSRVDRARIDRETVRFTLQLFQVQPGRTRPIEVVAHRPEGGASPRILRGAWIEQTGRAGGRGVVAPATLERTDRAALDPGEAQASAPGWDDLQRFIQTKDLAKQREILDEILEKYGDSSVAPTAAWCLAINRTDAGAPEAEVRALIDRAARLAARHGRETEIGAISLIVDNLIGAEGREGLILEYARKAVAMLQPDDPPALQIPTLRNLIDVLRRSIRIDREKAAAEVRALDERIATLTRRDGREPAAATAGVGSAPIPWARNLAEARQRARAEGKLIVVALGVEDGLGIRWLDAEVYRGPGVVEAMRRFVPVRVDPDDGEGRPLVARFSPQFMSGFPPLLFLDPGNDDAAPWRCVARAPALIPAATLVQQLDTVARLPREIGALRRKARPDDGEAMRLLATAMAMQGQVEEAAAIIDRAWGPGADPGFDRWAAVYNTLGAELILRSKHREALDWFQKAARVGNRPIDVYNAHLGAGFAAIFGGDGARAAQELEAAGRVDGSSDHEREFTKEWLDRLAKPPGGAPPAAQAGAATKRPESKGSSERSGKSP